MSVSRPPNLAACARLALVALALAACAEPAAVPPAATPTPVATATALPATAAATAASTAIFLNNPVPATSLLLINLDYVAFDAADNLYISTCDNAGPQLYKVDRLGLLTVYASRYPSTVPSGDGGPALAAGIGCAAGLAVDGDGNLYVSETWNNRIRRIDRQGIISTVAGSGPSTDGPNGPTGPGNFGGDGGPATAAFLNNPNLVAIDPDGNLYIADSANNRIRRVDRQGIITTVAGTGQAGFSGDGGPAIMAAVDGVGSIAFDAQGNLYLADNNRIRQVDSHGIIRTIAGTGEDGFSGDGGPATAAKFSGLSGMAFDAQGDLYVSDAGNHRIRKIDPHGNITTVVGTGVLDFSGDGGPALSAAIDYPGAMVFDPLGNLYFVDGGNNRVRKVDRQGIITTVVGGHF